MARQSSKKLKPSASKSSPRKMRKSTPSAPREGSVEPPTASQLIDSSQQTTDEWYKSVRTKKGYANYVKSGKEWLAEWTKKPTDTETMEFDEADLELQAGLAESFDRITEQTPVALRLLTSFKCDHQGRGFPTAEGLRSAFKHYFERVHNCQGEVWKYDQHSGKWEGNPVFESHYKAYFESLKNRENRTAISTQALPMLPKDMKVIMDYLGSEQGRQKVSETRRLYFKAFASTAFTLWTRNDELINLQCQHVKTNQVSPSGVPYIQFRLVFRKTNKDPTKGQTYQIPQDFEHPEIDCFSHMQAWLRHLEKQLQRPLNESDYIFPAISSTGLMKFGEPTSRSGFESLMGDIIEESGVLQDRHGRFTTHCFRRGGAQYRFMWAGRKWSLKAVKWWGGWSSSENVGTIMRYLLDELMAYEEGFGDIMLEDRPLNRHETFMGISVPTSPVTNHDLEIFRQTMAHQVQHSIKEACRSLSYTIQAGIGLHASPSQTSGEGSAVPQPLIAITQPPRIFSPALASAPSPPAPLPANKTPSSPSRIPVCKSLDDALRYWNDGAPDRGLMVPLRSWAGTYPTSSYASEAVKLGNIRFVQEEFTVHCDGNFEIFESQYPGLHNRYTKLLLAVREVRKQRGQTKGRRGRK